jgi:hypothetical protein
VTRIATCNVDLARRIIGHEWLYDSGQVAWAERILSEAGEDDERAHVEFRESLKKGPSAEFPESTCLEKIALSGIVATSAEDDFLATTRARSNPQLELFQ